MTTDWTPDYPRELAKLKKELELLQTKYDLLLDLYTDNLTGLLFTDYRGFYEKNPIRDDIDIALKKKVLLPPFTKI